MEIKFLNYTGEYPCLCFGTLTLLIDGRKTTFGDPVSQDTVFDHRAFWESGGSLCLNENGDGKIFATEGAWIIHEERLHDHLKPYFGELAEIMNKNVPHGHCGGCL